MISKEILRFLVAGGIAASVNWASRFLFSQFLAYEAAVVFAYCCGMVTGFFIMRRWVFHAEAQPMTRQVSTYVLVNLFGLSQTLLLSSLFARWLLPAVGLLEELREPVAHAIGIAAPVFTSFIGHKRATFKKPEAGETQADVEGTGRVERTTAAYSGESR